MKIRKSIPKAIALLLTALFLLSSCTYGIVDPIGDLDEENGFAPYLSEEEADALFGAEIPRYSPQFDGPYMYFVAYLKGGKKDINGNDPPRTVYRYNCETGETDYACQDSVCTHGRKSGCPFEDLCHDDILVTHGRIFYITWGDENIGDPMLKYYCPETRECGIADDNVSFIFLVGDFVYFVHNKWALDVYEDWDDPHLNIVEEVWRLDPESLEATYLHTAHPLDGYRPYLIGGKEMLLWSTKYDPNGEYTEHGSWEYMFDPATGETSLLWDSPTTGIFRVSGDWFTYDEYDYAFYDDPNNTGFPETTLHLANYVTGEDIAVGTYAHPWRDQVFLTESKILWLRVDPEDEFSKTLFCYDILTGESKEYPMQSPWWSNSSFDIDNSYYRGRLYFTSPVDTEEWLENEALYETNPEAANKKNMEWANRRLYLEWDICTGKQRVIDRLEVFEPTKSAGE